MSTTSRPVRYTQHWNSWTGQPIPGSRWLSEDEARDIYAGCTKNSGVTAVDASHVIDLQTVRGRWSLGFNAAGWVRVHWMDMFGSVLRESDYEPIDGKLFRQTMTDYAYPAEAKLWLQNESLIMIDFRFYPDGRTAGRVKNAKKGTHEGGDLELVDPGKLWMSRPEFGDWEALLDPWYGLPEDPKLPRSMFLAS